MFKRKIEDRDSHLSLLGEGLEERGSPLGAASPFTSVSDLDDRSEPSDLLEIGNIEDEWSAQGSRSAFELEERMDLDEPETIIGEGICIRGRLEFQRFLQIEGAFEGELVGEGKLVVGPSGCVTSDLSLREATIEGKVFGNIEVRGRLWLRDGASVQGNITARLLTIDEGASVEGHVSINPARLESDQATDA